MIGVAIVGLGWWGKTPPHILAESRRLRVVRMPSLRISRIGFR
jgi:hypothetical protein